MNTAAKAPRHAGFAMIEVLVTLVILLIGLLGLAGLQSRATTLETESYQRVQALVLVRDIADRLLANRVNAASYVTGTTTPIGQGSGRDCTAPAAGADFDLCQWDAALKGAAEASGACNVSTGANCLGAMLGARGCVTDVTPVTVPPSPPQYLIQVAWQGLAATATPPTSLICGANLYGNESLRRVVSTVVTLGILSP
jgi:type IV pilus assembly protein PilV